MAVSTLTVLDRVGALVTGAVEGIAELETLDRVGDALQRVEQRTVGSGSLGGGLRGEWLGHPVHPALTDLSVGFWTTSWVLDFGPESVTLLIGDVCGKGIEAASLTALARHTLRTAMNHVGDPIVALRWLHDSFGSQAPDSFVTAATVRLRPGPDGMVHGEAVSGGHPRPLIVGAAGGTEALEPGGTAPGLPVYRPAPVVRFDLRPGDALSLYTDGVTDVPGDGALTIDEIRELVADPAVGDADEAASGIGAALERVRPRRARTDDIALVVAKVPR